MLEALLRRYNITEADIEGDDLEDFYITVDTRDYQLWYQIAKHTNSERFCYGEFPPNVIKRLKLKGNFMITSTAAEFIEIQAKYHFYKRLYTEELDVFYNAFLSANDLLLPPQTEGLTEPKMEDYLKHKRILEIAAKIKRGTFRKQLIEPDK